MAGIPDVSTIEIAPEVCDRCGIDDEDVAIVPLADGSTVAICFGCSTNVSDAFGDEDADPDDEEEDDEDEDEDDP